MRIEEDEKQLSNGIWVFKDGNKIWGEKVNDNFNALNNLLNRHTLTFKQGEEVIGTFDNSESVIVDISKAQDPETLSENEINNICK